MKSIYWVLVANSSHARLFRLEHMNTLIEFQSFIHAESRLKDQDLISSSPGRSFESMGQHRHAIDPHTTPKEHEFELFAKSLATFLEEARSKNQFSRLYIAAGPSFLSLLRKACTPQTLELVAKQISKDLVHAEKAQILNEISI